MNGNGYSSDINPEEYFTEDTLDEVLQEAGVDLQWAMDLVLSMADRPETSAKRKVSFRLIGKRVSTVLPTWLDEIVEDLAEKTNCSKSAWLESATILAVLSQLLAYKKYGKIPTRYARDRRLLVEKQRALQDLGAIEGLLAVTEKAAQFWLDAMEPEPLAENVTELIDHVEGIGYRPKRRVFIRYVLDNWDYTRASLDYLKAIDHETWLRLGATIDRWQAEVAP